MTEWVLRSTALYDSETGMPLYWCNVDGWVDLDTATKFTESERDKLGRRIPEAAVWTTTFTACDYRSRAKWILSKLEALGDDEWVHYSTLVDRYPVAIDGSRMLASCRMLRAAGRLEARGAHEFRLDRPPLAKVLELKQPSPLEQERQRVTRVLETTKRLELEQARKLLEENGYTVHAPASGVVY